jgi:Spy/CpxP family protein refolding chaperone
MRKTFTAIVIAGTLGFAAPALASDSTTTPSVPSASQQCRGERDAMGAELFRATYGTNHNRRNAFGKCVSKRNHATKQARKDARRAARQECKTQGLKGKAYHQCVEQKVAEKTAATVEQQTAADVNAAQACKAERDADPAAFQAKYGTGHHGRNAFGKCVSRTAKQQS